MFIMFQNLQLAANLSYSLPVTVGLMVSAFASGVSGPDLSLGRDIVLCSWARHFTLMVPLSMQVSKWVLVNLMLGGNPAKD